MSTLHRSIVYTRQGQSAGGGLRSRASGMAVVGVAWARAANALSRSGVSFVPARQLNANRAVVTKVHREHLAQTYPTLLVLPDGATISVRYNVPRQIIKLPIDVNTCSPEMMAKVKQLRRPRGKMVKEEEISLDFDPLKYIK